MLMTKPRYGVVHDTCVLAPAPLYDTLLRLAEQYLFRVHWSDKTLVELHRVLTQQLGRTVEQADRRVSAMVEAFDAATITGTDRLSVGLPDPDDEHVLIAAIKSEAQAIVTFNVRDFPTEICKPHDVEVLHPDDFLMSQYTLDPYLVLETIIQQARDGAAPLTGIKPVLNGLRRDVPGFVDLLSENFAEPHDS